MPFKAKLCLSFLDFGFLDHFLLQRLMLAALGLWTQNHLKVVGTCSIILAMAPNSQLEIDVPKVLGLNPPP